MDSHLEVILERVKTLTEQTGTVVWFELPDSNTRKSSKMVLINQHNRIGIVMVDYIDKTPKLTSYKLTKPVYDELMEHNFSTSIITKSSDKKPIDTAELVKWIIESN